MQPGSVGYIYYLGGSNNLIYRYHPGPNTTETGGVFPFNLRDSTSISLNVTDDEVIIFGGYGIPNAVYALNLATLTVQYEATLPINILEATSVRVGDYAFIFDSGASKDNRQAISTGNSGQFEKFHNRACRTADPSRFFVETFLRL